MRCRKNQWTIASCIFMLIVEATLKKSFDSNKDKSKDYRKKISWNVTDLYNISHDDPGISEAESHVVTELVPRKQGKYSLSGSDFLKNYDEEEQDYDDNDDEDLEDDDQPSELGDKSNEVVRSVEQPRAREDAFTEEYHTFQEEIDKEKHETKGAEASNEIQLPKYDILKEALTPLTNSKIKVLSLNEEVSPAINYSDDIYDDDSSSDGDSDEDNDDEQNLEEETNYQYGDGTSTPVTNGKNVFGRHRHVKYIHKQNKLVPGAPRQTDEKFETDEFPNNYPKQPGYDSIYPNQQDKNAPYPRELGHNYANPRQADYDYYHIKQTGYNYFNPKRKGSNGDYDGNSYDSRTPTIGQSGKYYNRTENSVWIHIGSSTRSQVLNTVYSFATQILPEILRQEYYDPWMVQVKNCMIRSKRISPVSVCNCQDNEFVATVGLIGLSQVLAQGRRRTTTFSCTIEGCRIRGSISPGSLWFKVGTDEREYEVLLMQPIRLNLNINISTINDARGNLLQYFVRRGELADLLKRVCRLVNDRLIRSVSAFFQDTILGPMKDCYYVIQVSKIEDQALGSFDEPSDTYYDTDETTRLRIQKKLLDIDISMDDYDYEHDADAR